jgi:hypothetical protein
MTERELEQRLRTHLHRRFDGAQPPPELVASVRQAISTPPRRIGLPSLRAGAFRPGWLAIAAVVVVAVVAVAGFQLGILGPGANPTPSPAATPTTRHFIVLPSSLTVPDKAQTDLAGDVLAARLEALGFGNFTSSAGIEIKFELPRTGPSDKIIEDVLRATGDVEFVPLPAAQYGTQLDPGPLAPVTGEPLPSDEPALFGWDGIASVKIESDQQGRRTLGINLQTAAARAFGDYTASHVNELFAVLIDGRVASVPSINEPIPGGQLQVSFGEVDDPNGATMAILAGGKLPAEWAPPVVPHVRPVEEFIPQVQREDPSATFLSAELGVYESNVGFPWVAVWRMTFTGDFPHSCPAIPPSATPCTIGDTRVVTVDVETGIPYP